MAINTTGSNKIIAAAREYKDEREKTYRERALKLYPWVCGRCTREFTHKSLQELTVHHKDHNHDNNPSDGSNWELLCLYCHDNEHSRYEESIRYGGKNSTAIQSTSDDIAAGTHSPFANLKNVMNKK